MKIGLVAATMLDNNLDHQINQIKYFLQRCKGYDLLCFGESFLHGFEGLTWDYSLDRKRALVIDGPITAKLQGLAKSNACGLSCGFIERSDPYIYSSNMVIDAQGKIINVYRRVTRGWKEPTAGPAYREGEETSNFNYLGRRFATAICGDLWDDAVLAEYEKVELDAFLWPVYIDYSVEKWRVEFPEYAERVSSLNCPVLMINSFVSHPKRAEGGCAVFQRGKVIGLLPPGSRGVLEFKLS
ncbi:MAG TPA: carbon-nitrogen hydrolase family protein [Firmicutes bacterium]|nr:carbon-nitrogen hydrolase family protein [Bacillota bacterium]